MNDTMVSVICTCYNHEPYIRKALGSFVMQKTNFKYEVIVHDDASTDKSADIIREFEAKYPDIIKPIYQTENQYSKGVKIGAVFMYPKVRGKYVAFCEGDDYWCDENKLQLQVDFLESHSDYICCVHNTIINYLLKEKKEVRYGRSDKDISFEDVLKGGSQAYHTSSLLIKQEYLFNRPNWVGMVPGVGDYPTSIFYALSGKIRYLGRVMSVYNCGNPGSWTVRVENNFQKATETAHNTVKMLRAADEYYKYKYSSAFQHRISEYEYDFAKIANDLSLIKSSQFFCFYKSEPFLQKLKIHIKYYVPWTRGLRRKLREKFR